MKNYLSLFIYIAIAGGLLAYILLVDQERPSTPEAEIREAMVFEVNAPEVKRMTLKRGPQTVVIDHTGPGIWDIVEPVPSPAAGNVIHQMLNGIAYVRKTREEPITATGEEREEKLKDWGLNPPVVEVELATADEVYKLHLGRQLPSGNQVFARRGESEDAPLLVLDDQVLRLAALQFNDMRSREVFPRDPQEVTAVTVRRAGEGIDGNREEAIELAEDGSWTLRKPLIYPVYKEGVASWLGKARGLRLLDFVSDEPENLNLYGLAAPSAQVILQYGPEEEPVTLLIGKPVPEPEKEEPAPDAKGKTPPPAPVTPAYFAKEVGKPSVITVPQATVDSLLNGLMKIRDRQILDFSPKEVERIVFSRGPKQISIWLDEHWLVQETERGREGLAYRADDYEVFDLIVALNHLEVFEFVKDSTTDLAPYGLDAPAVAVELQFKDPEGEGEAPAPLKLLLGKTEGDFVYAKLEGQPYVFAVPTAILRFLPEDALEMRHKRLFVLEAGEIETVSIEREGEPALEFKRAKDGLYTSNRENRVVDAAAAEALVSLLAQLRSAKWMPKGNKELADKLKDIKETYRMTTREGRVFELQVGGKHDDLGLAARAVLPDRTKEAFVLSADDLEFLHGDIFFPETQPADSPGEKPADAPAP